jgi:hypothetical protein
MEQVLIREEGQQLLYTAARHNRISIEQLYLLESYPDQSFLSNSFLLNCHSGVVPEQLQSLCDSLYAVCRQLNLPHSENPCIKSRNEFRLIHLNGSSKYIQPEESRPVLIILWSWKRINAYRKILYASRMWRDANPKASLKIVPVNIDFARMNRAFHM